MCYFYFIFNKFRLFSYQIFFLNFGVTDFCLDSKKEDLLITKIRFIYIKDYYFNIEIA